MISDYNLDVLCLTETWLKPNNHISLNEFTPQDYSYKHEPRLKGKGGGVAVIYSNILKTTKKSSFSYTSFEVLVLNVKIYSANDKSRRWLLYTGHQGTIKISPKNLRTFYQNWSWLQIKH